MRTEREIFSDLAELCAVSGYVHVVASLSFRDNVVPYTGEMKPEDMQHMFARSRLVRTETSTLIGLLIKQEIDFTLPPQSVLKDYLEKTETLLEEIHHATSAPMLAGLDPKKISEHGFNPFTSGTALREPIFYGGESAYSFQYRDLSPRKYANDEEWLMVSKGFTIAAARDVAYASAALGLSASI